MEEKYKVPRWPCVETQYFHKAEHLEGNFELRSGCKAQIQGFYAQECRGGNQTPGNVQGEDCDNF